MTPQIPVASFVLDSRDRRNHRLGKAKIDRTTHLFRPTFFRREPVLQNTAG